MASVKKTTKIYGLKVHPHPEHMLRILYGKILRILKKIPPEAAYRRYTEEIVKSRLQAVIDSKNIYEIEEKVNCGQVEELIKQAESELILARKNLVWKPWEPLVTEPLPSQWSWPPSK